MQEVETCILNRSGIFKYLLPDEWNLKREYHTQKKYKKNKSGDLYEHNKGRSGKIDFVLFRKNKLKIGIEIKEARIL